MGKGVVELEAAPAHPRVIAALHLKRGIGRERISRLGDLALTREHRARHDERLRAGAAFRQPALDQKLVNPNVPAHAPASPASALTRTPYPARWKTNCGAAPKARHRRCAARSAPPRHTSSRACPDPETRRAGAGCGFSGPHRYSPRPTGR